MPLNLDKYLVWGEATPEARKAYLQEIKETYTGEPQNSLMNAVKQKIIQLGES